MQKPLWAWLPRPPSSRYSQTKESFRGDLEVRHSRTCTVPQVLLYRYSTTCTELYCLWVFFLKRLSLRPEDLWTSPQPTSGRRSSHLPLSWVLLLWRVFVSVFSASCWHRLLSTNSRWKGTVPFGSDTCTICRGGAPASAVCAVKEVCLNGQIVWRWLPKVPPPPPHAAWAGGHKLWIPEKKRVCLSSHVYRKRDGKKTNFRESLRSLDFLHFTVTGIQVPSVSWPHPCTWTDACDRLYLKMYVKIFNPFKVGAFWEHFSWNLAFPHLHFKMVMNLNCLQFRHVWFNYILLKSGLDSKLLLALTFYLFGAFLKCW